MIFSLPPDLLLATQPGKQVNASAKSDGVVKLATSSGELQAPFELSGSGSNVSLGALTGQGSSGLSGFGGSLSLNGAVVSSGKAKGQGRRGRAKKAAKSKGKGKKG